MSSGALKKDVAGLVFRIFLGAILATVAGGALAWDQPSEWPQLGMVSTWRELDTAFYRIYEDAPFVDQSQFRLDQAKQYARTREFTGKVDGITLENFLALSEMDQADRRRAAARELKFVADFRQRIETQVQRTRASQGSGWGQGVSDMRTVGDCIGKLRNAVSIDPSNPFAWHMLAYFTNIVGDQSRAAAALRSAQANLDLIPEDQLTDLRAEVALDRAWLLRDQGEFEEAKASLQAAVGFGAKGTSPRLLQGLIAAQTGDIQAAIEIADHLRQAEVRSFPANLRGTSFAPELADVSTWRVRTSNYLRSWILALTWLEEGNTDMAAAAFGTYSTNDQYPYAKHFWNDAGRIYEMSGRRSLAQQAWSMARINIPYIVYFVYMPYAADVGMLTGRPGAIPFFMGFDLFYMAGSRLAYAASVVEQVAALEDEFERQELASRALEGLDLLLRSGTYPGQAQVLKGQTYYLMGDLGSALIEVESALDIMEQMGDEAGFAAVLQGLAKSESELGPTDVANFYSQRGSSGGRWIKPKNLDAELEGLRQAYGDDPSDVNRHALARFLIRNGEPVEGRALAMGPLKGQELGPDNILQLSGDDLALVLEADREEGEDELALALVRALDDGAEDPWNHAVLWIYAGFICLDGGDMAEARIALERAQELDPGNHALKIQLAFMDKANAQGQ